MPVLVLVLAASRAPARTGAADWPTGTLESAGIDARPIAELLEELRADPHRDLKSLLIVRHGVLVSETYFNGADREALHDIRSAGKSITALLVGIAIDQKVVGSVDDPVTRYFPDQKSPDKDAIRVRDVLTMRAGLAAEDSDPSSPGNEDRLDASDDWVGFTFRLPMKSTPGTTYAYASVVAFLAGAIVENAAGMRLDEFARRHLFEPLGISAFAWRQGPGGRGVGQGNLSLRSPDVAKIGQLILDGDVYKGRRVVSAGWVRDSLQAHVPIGSVVCRRVRLHVVREDLRREWLRRARALRLGKWRQQDLRRSTARAGGRRDVERVRPELRPGALGADPASRPGQRQAVNGLRPCRGRAPGPDGAVVLDDREAGGAEPGLGAVPQVVRGRSIAALWKDLDAA